MTCRALAVRVGLQVPASRQELTVCVDLRQRSRPKPEADRTVATGTAYVGELIPPSASQSADPKTSLGGRLLNRIHT